MKIARICMAILATFTLVSIAAAQCGPAKPKTTAATGSLDEMIVAQAQQIIDAIKKRDAEAFKSHVDPAAYDVTPSGTQNLTEIVANLFSPDVTVADFKMENPTVKMIEKNSAVITYTATATTTYKGKTESGSSFDTIIFVRRGAKWMAIFHQATDMAKPAADMSGEK